MEEIIAAPEPIHFRKCADGKIEPFNGYLGSGIKDKHGKEIFENDTLVIDFNRAAKVIGDGSLIDKLTAGQFSPDARKKIFRPHWRAVPSFAKRCGEFGAVATKADLHDSVHRTGKLSPLPPKIPRFILILWTSLTFFVQQNSLVNILKTQDS